MESVLESLQRHVLFMRWNYGSSFIGCLKRTVVTEIEMRIDTVVGSQVGALRAHWKFGSYNPRHTKTRVR